MLEVTFDSARLMRALTDLQQASGDLSPALREIAEDLIDSTKQRFSSKIGPNNERWADNSEVTIWAPKKNPGGGYSIKGRNDPLVDGGTLAEQINYQLDGDTLRVGSPMEYAAMQQFGGTKAEFPQLWGDIPPRPFLGISEEDERGILDVITRHLNNAI